MTEEWLEEAKSFVESEEKQNWWAERSSFGNLDTWLEREEECRGVEPYWSSLPIYTD